MKHARTPVHCSPTSHQRSWQTRAAWAVVGLAYALCGHIALAQEKSASKDSLLPSRSAAPVPAQGLASLYPGDEGIERDPRVLFVEDFETGNLQEIESRWGNRRVAAARMELVPDRHAASPGERSLFIGIGGPDALQPGCCGGHLYTHTRAVDQMHVRFYVKFHEKHGYMHHHVFLIADREPTPWPKGWAGKKPSGDYHFSTAIEPRTDWGKIPPPGAWNFYSYWQEMKPDGIGHYWGNQFPAGTDVIPRGEWICVEAMVKANSSPEKSDGEQAFWIDGKQVGRFTGIRWRSTNKLKLNSVWLMYNVDKGTDQHNNDPDPQSRRYEAWFDDVVVATEYIGPVQGRPRGGKKAAQPGKSALLTGQLAPPAPGKIIFSEHFENGPGKFQRGEIVDGGVQGSKALAIPPKGASVWNAFSTVVEDSTTVRFKLKPLADVGQVSVLIWSDKLKDNARYFLTGLKANQWNAVEFRGSEARAGWDRSGLSLDGHVLNNLLLLFDGPPDARILLDDFEVRE